MQEVSSCLRMLDEVYAVFGLTYTAALSTRPEGYLGELEQWDRAEAALREALDVTGKGWEVRCCWGPSLGFAVASRNIHVAGHPSACAPILRLGLRSAWMCRISGAWDTGHVGAWLWSGSVRAWLSDAHGPRGRHQHVPKPAGA